MANPSKAKGTAWESAVRDYMNKALGLVDETGTFVDIFSALNVRRAAQEGARDVGDVHAVPFVLECKDVLGPAVPAWLRQAHVEAAHAGYPYGVAVHKVRRAAVARGRVHFGVRTWTRVRVAMGLTTPQMRERYAFAPAVRGLDSTRWYLTTDMEHFTQLVADLRTAR
ncbi:hypothetical protein H9Y04_18335 [Streptomyces sp. TRM66268-LWL]|uniref:Uncharacterized protein n=1 Tax=Streptomyces polyasparticus TaxID=2767826 RepID=A0ABR7SI51_9ACTN|nr:hypothetical protein [Streptomyces polyasparticus]MBC9714519.1 hypothetical protein [Streptomyces polyasparticus]